MPIYDFNESGEQFESIDKLPDNRTQIEKQHTPLSIYNHDKPDLALAERIAEESINVGGAWVTLFLKEPTMRDEHPMEIFDEDADPQYRNGIKMKAFVKLEQWEIELTRWGVDTPLKTTVSFSRAILGKTVGFGRMVDAGDVIEVPYNRSSSEGPLRFRVINESDSGNQNYRWLYFSVECELMPGDESLNVPYERRRNIPNPKEVRRG